jgi:protein transport protein SEC31
LAWSPYTKNGKYPAGIIAAGTHEGSLCLYNAAAIMSDSSSLALLGKLQRPGAIRALQFSSIDVHNLCAGGPGHLAMIDCTVELAPNVVWEPGTTSEVSAVAWNTKVPHIVATAATDGIVTVWDVVGKKQWCDIRTEACSDLAWNPAQGLHLLTAAARSPSIQIWDLGNSNTVPYATLSGHASGIFRAAWCPHDDSYAVTVSEDNRTLVWDLQSMSAVAEIPHDAEATAQATTTTANTLFSSGGFQEQKQLRDNIKWSPFQRGVCLLTSLDRKVQFHSIATLPLHRPPAWMRPGPPVSTAFGGIVVSLYEDMRHVTIQTVSERPDLVEDCLEHETAMAYQAPVDFCAAQQEKATSRDDKAIWGFIQVLLSENARQELLLHLGYDSEKIAEEAGAKVSSMNGTAHETMPIARPTSMSTETVKRALVVGNFEAAVEACFQAGNLGDALLLASCSGGDLWVKTQERYFASEAPNRPFLTILSSVVQHQFDDMIQGADTKDWRETLAIISSYSEADEFPRLCSALGDKLLESGDLQSASLCYMCAHNLQHVLTFWRSILLDKVPGEFASIEDIRQLHDFVRKVSSFSQVASAALTPEVEEIYTIYSQVVAEQGLLVTAAKYCAGHSSEANVLRDRLYRSRASLRCFEVLQVAPEFPYEVTHIEDSQGQVMAQASEHYEYSAEVSQAAASVVSEHYQEDDYATRQSVQVTDSDELPPGWVALYDASSNNWYFANEATGETTWDRPQLTISARSPAELDAMDNSVRSQITSQSTISQMPVPSKSSLASKYGDGFVTSASNPELANQYGNVGTSNPYGGAARPGPAKSGPLVEQPPVSGSLNFDSLSLNVESATIKDTLLGLAEAMKGAVSNPVEKRQIAEGEKAVAILVKKIAMKAVDDSVIQQVMSLVNALSSYDFANAGAIQTSIANNHWRDHKDWLKGIKILVQLAAKKYA